MVAMLPLGLLYLLVGMPTTTAAGAAAAITHVLRLTRRQPTAPANTSSSASTATPRLRSTLDIALLDVGGSIRETGYFYASVNLGTPPRTFDLILDTGSTVSYVPCSDCGSSCGRHAHAPFDPGQSSTYTPVGCGDAKCYTSGCQGSSCYYSLAYAEGSEVAGKVVQDHLHLGGVLGSTSVVFGCTMLETGLIKRQDADGLMGLGRSAMTFPAQLAGAGKIDHGLALCFGAFEGDGYLILGVPATLPPSVPAPAWTALVPYCPSSPYYKYYVVTLEEVHVGSINLDTRAGSALRLQFARSYGTVLDSGTTFTYFPSVAYRALEDELNEQLPKQYGLQKLPAPDPMYPDDQCWQIPSPPAGLSHTQLGEYFPTMTLRFAGATLTLGPANYLWQPSGPEHAYCLGVFDNRNDGALLGGITFRNTLVVYDQVNERVGFSPNIDCEVFGDYDPSPDSLASLRPPPRPSPPPPRPPPSPPPLPTPPLPPAPPPPEAGKPPAPPLRAPLSPPPPASPTPPMPPLHPPLPASPAPPKPPAFPLLSPPPPCPPAFMSAALPDSTDSTGSSSHLERHWLHSLVWPLLSAMLCVAGS